MPEKDDTSKSGISPAGPRIIRISDDTPAAERPVPRVIRIEDDSSSQPTNEGTSPRRITINTPHEPVVERISVPRVLDNLPGVQRFERIEVSITDLQSVDPNIQDGVVLKAAQQLIASFNFHDGQEKKFLSWGQKCLEEYASIVETLFEKLQNDATLARLAEVRLELAEALGNLSWKKLQKGGWFSDPHPDEVRQKFNTGYQAITPLITEAEALKPKLLEWKRDVEAADAKIKSLILEVSASIVAGAYLVSYGESNIGELPPGTAHQLPIMKDRVTVLRTQLIIMLDDQLYQGLRNQALGGYSVVVETLGIDIPRWQMLTLAQITQPEADRSAIEEISSRIRKALTSTKWTHVSLRNGGK